MYTIEKKTLTDIADAIRGKTGKSELIKPEEMAGEIVGISGGGDNMVLVTELTSDNFDESSQNWGLFQKQSANNYSIISDGSVRVTNDTLSMDVSDLGSFCAHAVVKSTTTSLARILQFFKDNSAYGYPTWFQENGKIMFYDNRNVNTGFLSTDMHIISIAIDKSTNRLITVIDGNCSIYSGYTKLFNYIYFNGSMSSYKSTFDLYYLSVKQGNAPLLSTIYTNIALVNKYMNN